MSKELLRNYVMEQNFTNANEVLDALKGLFRDVLQEALEAELRPISLNVPRDRNGEFEPQIVPKHQRNINGIEEKVLALYSAGMTTRDISEQIKKLYDVKISADTVSNITNRIMPLVSEWQNRHLENTYSFIYG